MSTTRYKIRLWEYDGEASVANAVTFDSFDEARRTGLLARFLYAFGYRIGGDAWRENRRPRLR